MSEEPRDTHYEVELDPAPEPTREPVYVDVVTRDHERRPVVPASLHRGNLAATIRYHAGRAGHRAAYHAVRSPRYALLAGLWAIVGAARVVGKQVRWWWVLEQHQLRQDAATKGDPQTWQKLHAEARTVRSWRGVVLGAELVALLIVVELLVRLAPWWAQVAAVLVAVIVLAPHGRPADRPILTPAIVTPRYRRLTADIVLRAYYAAKLGRADKPDQQVTFGSVMARDGEGSRVVVDLPHGGTWEDVIKAKPAIASGLDVSINQVFLTKDRSSHRRHLLFVADQDPLAIPAGLTPLLDCRPRDIWVDAPLGLDERGAKVNLTMMWNSLLVGAQPRKGKTFATRALALYAALDPYVRLTVVDGKMSPDWDKFRLVAHRYVCGVVPNSRDRDPIGHLLDALREIEAHIQRVNEVLSGLPTSVCPEGKLTRELAREHPELRVWVLVMEEFQNYFETEDQEVNKQVAALLSFIMAVGPSSGVILLSSSQKPSGVGAGDVQRLFNRFRDNHAVRFALKCGNRDVSMAILGGDAYGEGYDASALPVGDEYRGVGLLYGASDRTPTVRTYLADHPAAELILTAARGHREAAGTLTGLAAGEEVARTVRDVLADVAGVFYAGEAWVSWQALAGRLAETLPESYAGTTAEAISAQVRALGAAPKKGRDGRASLWGVPREQVEAARQRREIGRGR